MSGGAVPVVDLAQLATPEALAEAIRDALSTVGFLFITSHGLEADVEEMFAISEDFFKNETVEEKQRCAYKDNKGYVKVQQEVLDPVLHPEGDLKENFNTGVILRGPPPITGQPLPAILLAKADRIAEFQYKCFLMCQRLLEAFAIALGIDSTFFTSQHSIGEDCASLLRLLHYPSVPGGAKISPNRAGAHSDYGSLTLLFQRSSGGKGLQILPSTERIDEGKWQDVGDVGGAMLVNVGDAMEYWTGAQMKSTLHRVRLPEVIPPEGIPSRYSIAWFCQPNSDAILKSVLPPSEISEIDLERMARKGVTPGGSVGAGAHLHARLSATYKLTA